MRRAFTLLFLIACLTQTALAAAPIKVTSIRMANQSDKTRLVFSITKPVHYDLFQLFKPRRVVLDIKQTKLATNLKKLELSRTPIKDIRSSENKNGTLRLVLDVENVVEPKSFQLKPSGKYPQRLVLDLYKARPTKTVRHVPLKNEPRDVIVVIDPGHGGKDPGAIGRGGVEEKNVVLAISKDLQRDINREPGMHAVLTRKSDYYLTLRDRLRIARKDKGDIFVAVHADMFRDPRASGASVYALSERGATSEAARWIAEKENYSELGGVDLGNKSRSLRQVLIDLSQAATIGSSLQLGTDVLQQLGGVTRLHRKHVEQARFVVLKSPDIPSILIESGFISNPKEARQLRTSQYQKRLADAMMQGIHHYFLVNPPPGTWLYAHRKNPKYYRVAPGDTLSAIASRFDVSTSQIKSLNGISKNQVNLGERLRIPTNKTV